MKLRPLHSKVSPYPRLRVFLMLLPDLLVGKVVNDNGPVPLLRLMHFFLSSFSCSQAFSRLMFKLSLLVSFVGCRLLLGALSHGKLCIRGPDFPPHLSLITHFPFISTRLSPACVVLLPAYWSVTIIFLTTVIRLRAERIQCSVVSEAYALRPGIQHIN